MITNLERRPISGAGDHRYYHHDCIADADDGSIYSTLCVSAPSSPARAFLFGVGDGGAGFFHSAPTSPVHYADFVSMSERLTAGAGELAPAISDASSSGSFEFVFSDRVDSPDVEIGSSTMSSADELFLNGQIRPMKLSGEHLHRPPPLLDLGGELERGSDENEETETFFRKTRDSRFGTRSQRRRARSFSPLRKETPFDDNTSDEVISGGNQKDEIKSTTPAAGRSSKRWDFFKDFLRSKSEGSSRRSEKMSTAPQKIRIPTYKSPEAAKKRSSAHEMHYTAKRAEVEERRKKTYLPYKQGVLGFLGFNSKNYGAINGYSRPLNPIFSR